MEIENYLSKLDSARFGFKVAKINDFVYAPEELLRFLKENNVLLILTKVSIDNLDLINSLEKLNFTIKDFQLTYRFDLKNFKKTKENAGNELNIRDFAFDDIQVLKKIASESFAHYGHYANDHRLDQKKCNEIYVDWISRSCEDRQVADKIFVAEYKKELAGFLSFKLNENDNLKYAAGGIGAVAERYRNLNIFRKLTYEGLYWGKNLGLIWEEHNVLINNYPVNRSFVKSGFYPYKSFVTMHCWLD
jgi:hypothetical protein